MILQCYYIYLTMIFQLFFNCTLIFTPHQLIVLYMQFLGIVSAVLWISSKILRLPQTGEGLGLSRLPGCPKHKNQVKSNEIHWKPFSNQ